MDLLTSLIIVSEKAANIARTCRENRHLFRLLVQEKGVGEANPRFVQDFKTLADVLIQETVRHDVGAKFTELKDNAKGEESNIFCNKLGETIKVEVLNSVRDTTRLLARVLNDDLIAAALLAEEVHREIDLGDVNARQEISAEEGVDINSLGIWIDPIDSTSEYISGIEKKGDDNIFLSGLRCVTVLIGVYNRVTGKPVIGVINQPFYEKHGSRWRGKCYWGTSNSGNVPSDSAFAKIICVSSSEEERIKSKLREGGYTLVEVAGAGYKLLTVILGLAGAYVLTKNSTFKWDTCGPQAILQSSGGDLVVLENAIKGQMTSVDYKDDESFKDEGSKIQKYCNYGGIIAYRNVEMLKNILDVLRQ